MIQFKYTQRSTARLGESIKARDILDGETLLVDEGGTSERIFTRIGNVITRVYCHKTHAWRYKDSTWDATNLDPRLLNTYGVVI